MKRKYYVIKKLVGETPYYLSSFGLNSRMPTWSPKQAHGIKLFSKKWADQMAGSIAGFGGLGGVVTVIAVKPKGYIGPEHDSNFEEMRKRALQNPEIRGAYEKHQAERLTTEQAVKVLEKEVEIEKIFKTPDLDRLVRRFRVSMGVEAQKSWHTVSPGRLPIADGPTGECALIGDEGQCPAGLVMKTEIDNLRAYSSEMWSTLDSIRKMLFETSPADPTIQLIASVLQKNERGNFLPHKTPCGCETPNYVCKSCNREHHCSAEHLTLRKAHIAKNYGVRGTPIPGSTAGEVRKSDRSIVPDDLEDDAKVMFVIDHRPYRKAYSVVWKGIGRVSGVERIYTSGIRTERSAQEEEADFAAYAKQYFGSDIYAHKRALEKIRDQSSEMTMWLNPKFIANEALGGKGMP